MGRRVLLPTTLLLAACGSSPSQPSSPTPPPTTLFVLTAPTALVYPQANFTAGQNDPQTGCAFAPHRGTGFKVHFYWTGAQASAGIAGYELSIDAPNLTAPAFDQVVGDPYDWKECKTFVPDGALAGWKWMVRTIDRTGQKSPWSQPSTFNFAPCRTSIGVCE
jgi:hypothetical protein